MCRRSVPSLQMWLGLLLYLGSKWHVHTSELSHHRVLNAIGFI